MNNATDVYGFNALPGGMCDRWGAFEGISTNGNSWTASESDVDLADAISIYCFTDGTGWNSTLNSGISGPEAAFKINGLSVRCVKD